MGQYIPALPKIGSGEPVLMFSILLAGQWDRDGLVPYFTLHLGSILWFRGFKAVERPSPGHVCALRSRP